MEEPRYKCIWVSFSVAPALEYHSDWGNFRIVDLLLGEIKDGKLHIGQTKVPVYNPENKTKVPDVLFYENHQVRTVRILFHLQSAYGQSKKLS